MRAELAMALQRVGASIMECRRKGYTDGRWEGMQYKTAADLIADERLSAELRRIADIAIVSEERIGSQSEGRPQEYWLIDPIDGTASFAHGFPGFVCQAALIREGVPQLSGVYAPALDKLYMAVRDDGATVNGCPMKVRSVSRQRLTMVDNYPQPRGVAHHLFRDLHCTDYLESGSIGLKICLVAEGVADVFVKDVRIRDWDVAAAHLVLQESGGLLTQFTGQSFDYRGGYEKHGLVAVRSAELLHEIDSVVAWYSPRP
ncbi:MAG: 3'(2'),5'-bisphosphate nucleotidase CysQ family protein [Nitrospiraceae bacterium]